jgi:uncharacterized protein YebE (UPF0316 family)
MTLFFVGILEMLIVTSWTKIVTKSQVILSGFITFVNVLVWYYVLQKITEDIRNITLVLLYAAGCAIGTILTLIFFKQSYGR